MLRKVYGIFWNAPGARPVWIASLMLLASIADMFSMGALVPLVAQLTGDSGPAQSSIAQGVARVFAVLGLSPSLGALLVFVGVGLVLKSVIALASMTFAGISVADVTTKIRSKMLFSMIRANWAYFIDRKPGEVASQIAAQSGAAGQAFLAAAAHVTTLISGIGLFAAAALISPLLLLVSLIAMAVLVGPLTYVLKLADRASKQQWQASNDLTTGLEDVVNNMKPIKAMGRQDRFVEGFNANIRAMRGAMIQTVSSGYATFYGQDVLATVLVLAAVWVCVEVLHAPLSQFVAFGVVFYQMVDVEKRIQQSLQNAVAQSAGYFGVMDTIENGEAHAEAQGGREAPPLAQSLKFEDVSFTYGAKPVLSHVNVEIPARKISLLVGPSGSGKTTFLDLVIGFNRPTRGRILVDGADLAGINLQSWRHEIGYVPQELTLLRGNVADNIRLGDDGLTMGDINEALALAGAAEFVAALPQGINTDIGTMGAKLSGGQRQRISLARALVHKPKLLLLDEVTSALDEVTEEEICRNISALSGRLTILAITHRPAWRKIADKIWRISGGKAIPEKPVKR